MNAKAREALALIQDCIARDRYRALPHFLERLDQRGLFWPDVQAVIDAPDGVRPDGRDEWGRARWIVDGEASDGLAIEIVCVLDVDPSGVTTVFITIYWE